MTLKTLSQKNIVVSFRGISITEGLAATYCQFSYDNDKFSTTTGADGEVIRQRRTDNTATVTVTLMQTSLINKQLSDIYNLDANGVNGEGAGAFQIQDLQGQDLIVSPSAYISKPPDIAYGDSPQDRAWTFKLVDARIDIGGAFPN